MIDGLQLLCLYIGVVGGVVSLIILGVVGRYFVKRRRQPPAPWPVDGSGPAKTNFPSEPLRVSSPLFPFSFPSTSATNLLRRFIFPEPCGSDDFLTFDEEQRPLTYSNQSSSHGPHH